MNFNRLGVEWRLEVETQTLTNPCRRKSASGSTMGVHCAHLARTLLTATPASHGPNSIGRGGGADVLGVSQFVCSSGHVFPADLSRSYSSELSQDTRDKSGKQPIARVGKPS